MKAATNMTSSENCKGTNAKYDADDLDLFSHSLSIKLEYYRCFEYNLKWNRHMSPQCSSNRSKASKKRIHKSPTPSQDVVLHKPRCHTGTARLKNADGCKADEDDGKDLLNLIESTREDAVGVVHYGLDESDENLASDCSSIASGPSIVHHTTSKKLKSSEGLCSACRELYQMAKKTKAPIKNKLLDNDPKSLTCDQWVLIKKIRPRRLPEARQKRFSDVHLNKVATLSPGESPFCSRLHIFLQRNLRRVKMPASKERRKKRMKRRRDSPQDCRVAKQQRLQSDSCQKRSIPHQMDDNLDGCFRSCAGSGRRNNAKTDPCADPEPSIEHTSPSAVLKTTKPREVCSKPKAGEKKCGFKQLLAQLRGSSSMIVKEKH